MTKSVILVGGFNEVIELCYGIGYDQIMVIDKTDLGMGTTYIGTDLEFSEKVELYANVPLVITPDNPLIRKKLVSTYSRFIKNTFINLISSSSSISSSVVLGRGNIVQSGVHLSSNVMIGDFVKLNVNSCVMHDAQIANFSTLAPSCTILGRVNIGENCYIGASATILPEIKICNDVIVGAGAVVNKNISEKGTYVGVPARKIH